MTRDEAISILSRQPPEVREAAAVFVETSDIDCLGTTDSFLDLTKEFRAINQTGIDGQTCNRCDKPATIAAWWESGVGYACRDHEAELCKLIRPCPWCGNLFGVQ